MSFWSYRHRMGWAALIMGGSIFLSRFMGLVRDKIISFLFGATTESDLYFAAFVIPDFINYLLAGGYFSITLIPLLAASFEKDKEDGWRFFSAALTWIALSILFITGAAMIWAPQLARMTAPTLPPDHLARLTFFLRIILPAQVCFLMGSCFTALLYLRKQFWVPALTPLIYNLMIIALGVALQSRGMEGFCWGVLAGSILGNLLLPYWAARQNEGVKFRPTLYHPDLKRFGLLALPLMLGQSIVVLDEQLVRVFGSMIGAGAVSWLNYARRIMMVPVGVVAQAAGVASYPFLAELAARKDFSRFHQTLNRALLNTLTLLVPLSIWMIIVAEPIIRLIFEQGHFSPSDTERTARLLQISLIVVFCWGGQQILGRAFYARQDTITPAVLGTLTTLVSLPFFYGLTLRLQAMGVAMASAGSIALYTLILSLWWRHRFGKEVFNNLAKNMVFLVVLSLSAAVPSFMIARFEWISRVEHPYLSACWAIVASGLCFLLIFGLLADRFIPALVRPFLNRLAPRLVKSGS